MANTPSLSRKSNDIASFRGEQIIRLKEVSGLPVWLERPSYQRVKRWVKYGVTINGQKIFMRSRREGQFRLTSVEAVMEFQEAINR